METDTPQPRSRQAGGLQSMIARLRGMVSALRNPNGERANQTEIMPTWDAVAPPSPNHEGFDQALAVPTSAVAASIERIAATPPQGCESDSSVVPESQKPEEPVPGANNSVSNTQRCPACHAERTFDQTYCTECGCIFPPPQAHAGSTPTEKLALRLQGRYELAQLLCQRGDLRRYRGTDHGDPDGRARPVIILAAPERHPATPVADRTEAPVMRDPGDTDEMLIANLDQAVIQAIEVYGAWPDLAWEKNLLTRAQHPSLPRLLDHFAVDAMEYLVEEVPRGKPLWDAWDDPHSTALQRFGWLKQAAEALQALHESGAILEGLHPEILIVDASGRARLTDLSDLLPLRMAPNTPVRATCYSAPELVVASEKADARADLYSVGATLLALYLGRELTDLDFEYQGAPKSVIERMPDIHPLLARVLSKTFCRQVEARFPTEDAALYDPTGFSELIRALDVCGRTLDNPRLDIAAWTTTGMVRSGNEDGFILLHALEAREDDLVEAALVLLADGMGGQEGGEVAAAMAVGVARGWLLQQTCFAFLGGGTGFPEPGEARTDAELLQERKAALVESLREANRLVHGATKSNGGRREMGCTAEAVYVGGHSLLVAHVGDSRAYHLHQGELRQLTRDQTWVNRMVDLGALTQAEADHHPRRSELLQAIGGHADVDPHLVEATLAPGDWVLVCSDGLSNYLSEDTLKEMLLAAGSAEMAARRLVNMVNYLGAMDNATLVVIRAH